MRRERDVSGQVILIVEGSLPPGSNGPPRHVHFQEREEGAVKAGALGARIGDTDAGGAGWRKCGFSGWGRSLLVECRGNASGVQRSGSSGSRLRSIPPGFICCAQRQRDQPAVYFLSGSRALAASPHAESGDATCSDPADFVSSGPADWPRPRQVQGTGLAGMPRKLHRCSSVRSCDCCQ